jgi:Na+/proline symporter
MARRISAVLGILAIVFLVLLLMWRVYLHHRAGGDEDDEPGVIASLSAPHVMSPWHAGC